MNSGLTNSELANSFSKETKCDGKSIDVSGLIEEMARRE